MFPRIYEDVRGRLGTGISDSHTAFILMDHFGRNISGDYLAKRHSFADMISTSYEHIVLEHREC